MCNNASDAKSDVNPAINPQRQRIIFCCQQSVMRHQHCQRCKAGKNIGGQFTFSDGENSSGIIVQLNK